MNEYKLLLLPGDGIGPEVLDATMRVVGWYGQKAFPTRPRKRCWAARRSTPRGVPIRMRLSSRRLPPTPC